MHQGPENGPENRKTPENAHGGYDSAAPFVDNSQELDLDTSVDPAALGRQALHLPNSNQKTEPSGSPLVDSSFELPPTDSPERPLVQSPESLLDNPDSFNPQPESSINSDLFSDTNGQNLTPQIKIQNLTPPPSPSQDSTTQGIYKFTSHGLNPKGVKAIEEELNKAEIPSQVVDLRNAATEEALKNNGFPIDLSNPQEASHA